MKQEYYTKKVKDRFCSREREFTNLKPKKKDKQDRHTSYTTVCITNEYYTSRLLTHARSRIIKQDKIAYREIKGAFICYNFKCPSARHGRNTTSRDKMSALTIAISGMTTLLFQETLSVFSRTISHSNTELHNKTASFCTRSGVLAAREA
ncbi:hypothetical protein BD560DRAFT_391847 [Blakeslea trispora]|nr:hypothetical protein BD560DRAFT_391847 [Blakeslea trispora]